MEKFEVFYEYKLIIYRLEIFLNMHKALAAKLRDIA
jgi:hypothetical protein